MKDPNATLPEVDPNGVIEGVHYARLYLQHVLWDWYQMEAGPNKQVCVTLCNYHNS